MSRDDSDTQRQMTERFERSLRRMREDPSEAARIEDLAHDAVPVAAAAVPPAPAPARPSRIPVALKILIAGGFGAGKTTMVGSVSEIHPLQTEETLTGAEGADQIDGVANKTTTTVTMDFGRITISEDIQLYLFGTPGQDRFWFLWDELSQGALGAVVLADTRRLADCFPSIDYFEQRGTPFVVAVNCFDPEPRFGPDAVAQALDLDPGVPVVLFDAREPTGARNVLIELVEYVARRQLSSIGSRA